jgi:transcriptional regulator with XRE-family HTH domain
MTITGQQVKAARDLLEWSQGELAARSRMGILMIAEFEAGALELSEGAIIHLRWALQSAGVEFANDGEPGVKLRKGKS